MPLEFAPQCCDAPNYVALGEACAKQLTACWHGLRPTGALIYFSLPFRIGLPGESIIVLNALFTLLSAIAGAIALADLSTRKTRASRILLAVGAVALTSAIWAGLHVQYAWIIIGRNDWIAIGQFFGLGLLFGYLRVRSGSTLTTILLHAAYSAGTLIQAAILAA